MKVSKTQELADRHALVRKPPPYGSARLAAYNDLNADNRQRALVSPGYGIGRN